MDTSVTIIGAVITALMGIPLYMVFRSNSLKKSEIKRIMSQFPQYQFDETETQNKRVYALDTKNKAFMLIDFNHKPESVFVENLSDATACRIIPTTEGRAQNIVKIEFEFQFKDGKKELVPCYDAAHDQITQVCLFEDHELAKKWQKKIILSLAV